MAVRATAQGVANSSSPRRRPFPRCRVCSRFALAEANWSSPLLVLSNLHVPAQKRRHVEVLAIDDRRLAFLETAARDRLELQCLLALLASFWRRGNRRGL